MAAQAAQNLLAKTEGFIAPLQIHSSKTSGRTEGVISPLQIRVETNKVVAPGPFRRAQGRDRPFVQVYWKRQRFRVTRPPIAPPEPTERDSQILRQNR